MGIGNISTSGIKAALDNMQSISNNIANVNTAGYRGSYVNFSDIYSGGNSGNEVNQLGIGTRISSIGYDFSSGNIQSSSRGLDLALNKDGFFIQKDPVSGLVSYTRAGRFDFDVNNNLVGSNGIIQGYPSINGVINANGKLSNLTLSNSPLPPVQTAAVNCALNLNSDSAIITNTFNMNDATTYNYTSTETVYDSLGNASLMSVYYVKNANNSWTANVAVGDSVIGTGNLAFNEKGQLSSASGLDGLSWSPANGSATPQALKLNMTGSTQYQTDTRISEHGQDGYSSGAPINCAIDSDGNLNVRYSNGMNILQGQIAIAQFRAPQGLQKGDNQSWIPTAASGTPSIHQDTSFGGFIVNAIESSNVDLTEELIKLIDAQHDFQANAQVQQTYNQVMQTIEKL